MPAPLIVFVYNRLAHTQATLDYLNQNDLAPQTELFIFSDGAKKESDLAKVQSVRAYVRSFSVTSCFQNVSVIEATENNGLANSVIHGVTDIINRFGRVIVVEDDLLCSTDFLNFMNDGLDFYVNDPSIWSISGYTFPIPALRHYPHDIYLTYRGCSWGWATWKDRWETVDWAVSDYQQIKNDRAWRRRFSRSGADMPLMLDAQMAGEIDSWAIRWCYQQNKTDQRTVYPKYTRVVNRGLDGSGTHHTTSNAWGFGVPQSSPYRFAHIPMNRWINYLFRRHYLPPLYIRAINKGLRILGVHWQIPC